MSRRIWILAATLGLSCGTIPPETYETGPIKQPYDKVFAAAVELLEHKGYKFKEQNKNAGHIETEWKTAISPHWREGERYKVEMEFERVANLAATNIKVRALCEVNDTAANPESEKHAHWVSAGGKNEVAEGLRMDLKIKLKAMTAD